MTVTSTERARRILIVDDEEALAWSLASRLAKARPSDRVDTANDGVTALACLHEDLDLLVADIRMEGLSGIDLVLAARAAYPGLPVILMTAFKSAELERLSVGSLAGFLEKPFEFERLLELVERAFAPSKVGFSGAISVQTLPDIVQLYVLSSATGALQIRNADGDAGEVWFDQGAILHAVTPNARGDAAIYEIMTWSGGDFSMRSGVSLPERSVTSSWQELLIESCRRLDEKRHGARPGRGWTQAPPPMDDDFDISFDDPSQNEAQVVASENKNQNRQSPEGQEVTMNIKDSLAKLNSLDGFIGAGLVDSESGMLLGQEGGGNLNLEVAAAGNTEVVRAKRKTMNNLAIKDGIEDILITLGKQYHLIRPLRTRNTLFFYVALDRQRANLAMSRIALADVEKELQV